MFSDLKNKVAKENVKKKQSDASLYAPSFSANSRTNSNESLVSLNSATGSTRPKSDRLKHLESKLMQLGGLLREKTASLDAAKKQIDRLTSALALNQQKSQQNVDGLVANHSNEIKIKEENNFPQLKECSALSDKLTKAEADLAKVNKLSEEVLEQKNQQQKKANEELQHVKENLFKSEEEIHRLQVELTNKTSEIERLSCQLAQSTKELEVKNGALENSKANRVKMQDEKATQDEVLRLLRCDNEAAQATISELSATADQLRTNLRQQERLTVEESDRAGTAQAEAEKLKARLTSVEVRAADRESDMKDRIRLLEERLVLLTEPNDPLFAEQLEEAKLSSSSPTALLHDDAAPPGAAAARCITLLVERKLLENRLKDTRSHLEEVKCTWNENLTKLETQISHLNGKILEDSNNHEKAVSEWGLSRKEMESQLKVAREEFAEANAKATRLETEASERDRINSQQDEDWRMERSSLTAQIAALQQVAEEETNTHSKSIRLANELHSRISTAESNRNAALKELEEKTAEVMSFKVELEKKTKEIESIRATGEIHVNAISQLEQKIKELDGQLQFLTSSNGDLRNEIKDLNETLNSETAGADALRHEIDELKVDCQLTTQKLSETREALSASRESFRKSEDEKTVLAAKIEAMIQTQLATNKESTEVILLKENIETLNETIAERNKTIRLQKQTLADLKKAFGQGLRPNAPFNSSINLNEDEQTHETYANGGVLAALEVNIPPIMNQQVFPLLASPSRTNRETSAPFPFAPPHPPPSTNYLSSNSTTVAQLPVEQMHFSATNSQSDIDHVNFDYIRHVVLKFLLSQESEALKLVRVIATILHFSKEDEFLIRQSLESRKSWFTAPVVSPKSSGQFAKLISPPF